jgi:hypothetical protein
VELTRLSVSYVINIVAYLITARMVEPEKQSLLGNSCVTSNNGITVGSGFICVPWEKWHHATTKKFISGVFCAASAGGYITRKIKTDWLTDWPSVAMWLWLWLRLNGIVCSACETNFSAPLEIFQGAHRFAICTWLSAFRTYKII